LGDWFNMIAAGAQLSAEARRDLHNDGFAIVPGPVPEDALADLADAYDRAMLEADPAEASNGARTGSSTARVHDFVNRGPAFDSLYVHPPALEAGYRIIGQPFQLSTMLGRTLRPQSRAQQLHVDFSGDAAGWPMLGFIFMVDEFLAENGATCFVRGSQGSSAAPAFQELTRACGPAGSMILFNGSVWHGHGANQTDRSRRSIQGAYILREARPAIDLAPRMRPETLLRIGPLARYLLRLSGDE
jgi:hypothetical protein